ncbi:MAG TPA: hypothetical protein VN851_07105 [Thermoanaerobaculia bacterium]|nr:hypothetical protein [Thermoanaerobaculia bacterium]
MKIQRLAIILSAINLLLLIFVLSHLGAATTRGIAPVLRGHALEIVDEHGRVRAQITVLPASTASNGQKYAETVLVRLIDPNGRPGVKIGASEDGSGMSLAGDSERRDWNGVQILASGTGSSLKLTNKDGRARVIEP